MMAETRAIASSDIGGMASTAARILATCSGVKLDMM
jgi:hypothetical protein